MINFCAIATFNFTTMLGMFNLGFMLASWNMLQTPFQVRYDWSQQEMLKWSVAVTSASNIGLMIGAVTSGFLMDKHSKWGLIIAMNICLIMGVSLSLIDDMHFICVGKLLSGYAIGCLTVFCPQVMNELAPTEWKGVTGSLA